VNLLRHAHRDVALPGEELVNSSASRRQFLTRGALTAAGVAGGAAVLNAVMATPAAAAVGDVVLLGTPVRIYDSRPGQPFEGQGEGAGTPFVYTGTPTSRQVAYGDVNPGAVDHIPDTSTGAIVNIAVANTVLTGALAVSLQSAVTAPTTSLINWFGPSQILANSAIVPANGAAASGGKGNATISASKYWIVAGTPNASSCHFIVDCLGYVAGA
jgi:hypothetical protein